MFDPFCKINYNNEPYLFMDNKKSLAICDLFNIDISNNSNNIDSNCYFFDFNKYDSIINNNEFKKLSEKQKNNKLLKDQDYYYKKTNIPCRYFNNNNDLYVDTKISNDYLTNIYNIVKLKDNINKDNFANMYYKNMIDSNYKNNNFDITNYIDIIKLKNAYKYYYQHYCKTHYIVIFVLILIIIVYILYKYYMKKQKTIYDIIFKL